MILRNNNGIDVTDREIRKEFPAVFNHKPAQHCSEKYQLYRSDEIISRMADKGMKLVELSQQASRKRPPETQLHTMRFQPLDVPPQFGVNDSVPEVVVMNGHDGRNRFRAMAGIFRFICSNGMVVSDAELGQVVKRHFGENNTFDKVAAIVGELPDTINRIHSTLLDWSALTLDEKQQTRLAMQMIAARHVPEWVTSDLVLEARREQEQPVDGKRTMWTTFNVLQENLTNTELVSGKLSPKGNPDKRAELRPLLGAYRSLKANEALWTTAEAYYAGTVDSMSHDERDELVRQRKNAYERNRRAAKALDEVQEPAFA